MKRTRYCKRVAVTSEGDGSAKDCSRTGSAGNARTHLLPSAGCDAVSQRPLAGQPTTLAAAAVEVRAEHWRRDPIFSHKRTLGVIERTRQPDRFILPELRGPLIRPVVSAASYHMHETV